jgi:hypothetical protein
VLSNTVRSKIKKMEMAMINTLQLALKHNSRINASNYCITCEGHLKTWNEESNIMFGSWRQTFRTFTRKYDWSISWFFYNRQVTHNARLYENQDFNVFKITKLTFKTDLIDNWNFNELPTENLDHSQLDFFFRSHGICPGYCDSALN